MAKNIDLLLTNAIVLTMDEQYRIFEPGAVAVQADSIVAVGPQAELEHSYQAEKTVDCAGKVLMPGLINAHTHVPMTLLRGLADDLRLDVWLLGYMMPVEREFVSPEFVSLGTALACIESIRSGVTCFADMYYFEEQVAQTTAEAGLRALCAQTVLKFPSPDAQSYEESLDEARAFIQRWKGHALILPSVAPHAPYTCTQEILQATAALAAEFDVPLHTHLAETAGEVENSNAEHGMAVIPYVEEQRLFDAKVLAAHCVHISDNEMHILLRHQAGVAHNPTSNLKLASGVAPVNKMLELGLAVGIGTDGPASNNDLDMFEEVRLAALLAKGISGDPTSLPARTALAMATRLGARALHMGDITGALQPGLRADLILVDIHPLHNAPRFRRDEEGLYAQLVYAAKSTDVTDVMVNGRWLMRERQLLTLDETSLLEQAEAYARRIDAFLIEREQSVLSKLVAIGGAEQQESFEVQVKVRIEKPEMVLKALEKPEIDLLYHRHYHEFDTYFQFDDPQQGLLRYREDEFIGPKGEVTNVRYRLTHIGPARERHFTSGVLLSRSRFIAPATHSLRFYREYFKPCHETFVEKDRRRWRVIFRGTEFFINLDRIDQPTLGSFLEIKSRTWSQRDAEHKADLAQELVEFLGASPQATVVQDYVEFIREEQNSCQE
ncbi:MAG: amidohydrolase family protein [Anaerolineales bacterium]|nr:amidohydrolase family protein [Anaerolineales bacterium]